GSGSTGAEGHLLPGWRTRSVVAGASGTPARLGRRCRQFHAERGYVQHSAFQPRVEPGVRLAGGAIADAVQHEPEVFRDILWSFPGGLRKAGRALAGSEERLGEAGALIDPAAELLAVGSLGAPRT